MNGSPQTIFCSIHALQSTLPLSLSAPQASTPPAPKQDGKPRRQAKPAELHPSRR